MPLRFVSLALLAAMYSVRAGPMQHPKTPVQSFKVVGIQSRTTNAREMTSDGVIPKMWARLASENLLQRIIDRAGFDVVALYTKYQSDKDGEYDYVLGAKVSSVGKIPAGMVAVEVPAGDYARFSTESSQPPDAVVGLWRQIWSLEAAGQLHRAYLTDFEVHHRSSESPAHDNKAEIYIGVK